MHASSRFSPRGAGSAARAALVLVVGFAVLCAAVVAVGWLLTNPLQHAVNGENDVNRWFADQRTDALTDVAAGGTLIGETLTGVVALAVVGTGFAL